MTKEIEKLELTDDIYDALVEENRKVIVVGVDEDQYVVRYPNRVEFKALMKFVREGTGKANVGLSDKSMGLINETIKGLIVWPEIAVVEEREEYDGGLIDSISNVFISTYMSRTEEKKR